MKITNLGKFIRSIRNSLGESQLEMANKLGVSCAYISFMESGKRKMPPKVINKFIRKYYLNEVEQTLFKDAYWNDILEGVYEYENK